MRCSFRWKERLPMAKWLPNYSFYSLQCDFIAGITVALMVIPQALAYAVIAGLSPQYGLYSAFAGGFLYCLFGTCKDLAVGPAAIMGLMAGAFGRKGDPAFAIALTLYSGLVLLVMGLLSLGFIVRLIPIPVISGFTSAAAIIIASEQLPNLLGLSIASEDFFPLLKETFTNIKHTRIMDLVLGIVCMIILEGLRHFNRIQWPSTREFPPTLVQIVARKVIWLVEIGRNAIIVFACALIAFAFHSQNSEPFTLTGPIHEGLPSFEVPKLKSSEGNHTITTIQMITDIGAGLVVVPMIAFLTSIAIAQAFSRRNHYSIDPSQELIALGLANVAGSFFQSFPIAGCFSRTTVNCLSGVATPLGGVFTSCVVLLALAVLTPFFQYIPKASLAAVIIVSVLRMVNIRIVRRVWLTRKIDVLPLIITFFACLYEIAIGIACGIVLALFAVLYHHIRPHLDITGNQVCYVRITGGLSYMGVEYFMSKVREAVMSEVKPGTLLIDCSAMPECDFTVTQAFHQIVQDCDDRYVNVVLYKVQEHVKAMLINGKLPPELFKGDLESEMLGLPGTSDDSSLEPDSDIII